MDGKPAVSTAKATRHLAEQIERHAYELTALARETWRRAAMLGDEDAKLYLQHIYELEDADEGRRDAVLERAPEFVEGRKEADEQIAAGNLGTPLADVMDELERDEAFRGR